MAAVRENTNDLFIFADDFDAILAILEVDELLEKEIIQAVENVSWQEMFLVHSYVLFTHEFRVHTIWKWLRLYLVGISLSTCIPIFHECIYNIFIYT